MNRPWYSSGADELLGVVLEHQPWLTWPLESGAGLEVSASAQAMRRRGRRAAARRPGSCKAAGPASRPPAERLLEGIAAHRGRGAARRSARDRTTRRSPRTGRRPRRARARRRTVSPRAHGRTARSLDQARSCLLAGRRPAAVRHALGPDPIWGSATGQPGPYIHQFPLRVAVGERASPSWRRPATSRPSSDTSPTSTGAASSGTATSSSTRAGRTSRSSGSRSLAISRHPIPGQHLSKVVFPDFAQLVAERTAAVTGLGRAAVAVSLRGPGGYTENARVPVPAWRRSRCCAFSRFAVAQVERLPGRRRDRPRVDARRRRGSPRSPAPARYRGRPLLGPGATAAPGRGRAAPR